MASGSDDRPPKAHTSPSRRTSTRRVRPTVRPVSKQSRPTSQAATVPGQGDDDQYQTLSVEFQPIGGIFGAPQPMVPDESPAQPGRLGKMLRPIRPSRHRISTEPSLLADIDFRVLWLSRLCSQTAQGALLYALLILVVDLSDRSVFNSLFVICSIIPSILFALPAGLVADTVSRRGLLVTLNITRFTFMLLLVGSNASLAGVFAVTLGIWVIHQFYSPAEASMLADIVDRRRYTEAQAQFNLALTISQAVGLVIAAPILLRAGGPEFVFMFSGILWLLAGALTFLLPSLDATVARRRVPDRTLRQMLGDGWRFARSDRITFEAMIDDVLVGVGMSALVVIMPYYLERVLGTSKENTVFVFAPAALGLVFGLRASKKLASRIGERYLATLSLFIFAIVVAALGFVAQTYNLLNNVLHFPLDQLTDALGISPLIFVAMLLSIPAGFASAAVNVAARSILLARTPATVRGQVIATQSLIGNLAALIPILLAGITTDIFGVRPIAVAIAVAIVIAALAAHMLGRKAPGMPVVYQSA
ncbi:MAG TPA: MFS transporter [Thermomicrobiales bacterium]|nr:MFS transporter [Thermomicrobiales bacterium]